MMEQLVSQLHFYNMVLVLAAGTVAGIWGLILFFREKRHAHPDVNAAVGSTDVAEKDANAVLEVEVKENRAVDIPKRTLNRPWRNTLIVTAILALLQGVLGITLVVLGQKPGSGTGLYYLHYVYGAIVALAIPVALTYATGGKNLRRDILIYSLAALILAAAGARALMTGLGLP